MRKNMQKENSHLEYANGRKVDFFTKIILFFILFNIFSAMFSPSVEIQLNNIECRGIGSAAVHNTDDPSLLGKYYENIIINELTEKLVFHEYPIRGLKQLDIYFSMNKGDVSFSSIDIVFLGEKVGTISAKTMTEKSSNGESEGILFLNKKVVVNGDSSALLSLQLGNELVIKYISLYCIVIAIISALLVRLILIVYGGHLLYAIKRPMLILFVGLSLVTNGEILIKGWGFFSFKYYLLNVLIVEAILLLFIAIIGRRWGLVCGSSLISLVYLIDYFVTDFRGSPLVPWDIGAARTALSVINKYSFSIGHEVVFFVIIAFFVIFCETNTLEIKDEVLSIKGKMSFVLASLIIAVCVWHAPAISKIPVGAWGNDIKYTYKEYGAISSFTNFYINNRVKKPKKYSSKYIESLITKYSGNNNQNISEGIQPDQIIIIMNESFAQMDTFNSEMNINDTPFLDALKERSAYGNLYVSVRGGGTCNTEFEALTGNAMAFLPSGSYPFISCLGSRDVFSLANYFEAFGYQVAGLHIENGANWNREVAYPNLGIQDFYTIDDFNTIESVRGFATDEFDYKELSTIVNEMKNSKKFIFNVTLQNHGGYADSDEVELLNDLSDLDSYVSAKIYFSLIRMSDKALELLINTYSDDPQKTMIVFFGDHQPVLESEAESLLFGNNEDALKGYQTPLIIWKNYDEEKREIGSVSANYLPEIICREANYPLTPFLNLTAKVAEYYPVITSLGILDSEGNYYRNLDDVDDTDGVLSDYMIAQYNNLFDKKRNNELFQQ